ncbi:hypothetical protein [Streptomyces albiaxialis]|uniref:hypothetical protein n=1 Tax=Streptomyces albiaxialis TaxID=329523 RepID=UPI003CD08946
MGGKTWFAVDEAAGTDLLSVLPTARVTHACRRGVRAPRKAQGLRPEGARGTARPATM